MYTAFIGIAKKKKMVTVAVVMQFAAEIIARKNSYWGYRMVPSVTIW